MYIWKEIWTYIYLNVYIYIIHGYGVSSYKDSFRIAEFLSVFDIYSWRGLNRESLDYGSDTLTTAPSNPDDWVMK